MFDAGSIVGKLILDTSSFQASAVSATQKIEQIGQSIVSTTRQLTRAASSMTFLGAAITAPIILAFKSAEKYSNPVRTELQKMNNAFIGLRVSVAESLLPVMHQFGNAIADLVNRWNSLSPALRESMLRTAMMTGVFLTLGGAISMVMLKIVMLIGKVIELSAAFMTFAIANPELLLIRIAILGIVLAMFKWKEVGDIVMNTIQILCDVAWVGLNSVLFVTDSIAAATLAIIPGCKKLSEQYTQLANDSLRRVGDAGKNVWDTLATGQSNVSKGFDNMKTQMQAWGDLFKNLGSQEIGVKNWQEASKTFAQGWTEAIDKTIADLSNWGAMAGSIVSQSAAFMQSSISGFLQNIGNYLDGSKNIWVEFGNFIMKIIADVIAQLITLWIVQKMVGILASFGSSTIAGGKGGVTTQTAQFGKVWSPSFAEGTDSIPYTGNYRLHEGEKITPKYDTTKNGGGNITILNQITPGFINSAIVSEPDTVINVINEDTMRNGITRKTYKRNR